MVNLNIQFMTFNQFWKFGTPIHKKQNLNLNLTECQLKQWSTWISNSCQFSKFGTPIHKKQNLNLNLNLKEGQHKQWSTFQFMTFNQFFKFGTPIHKNQIFSLKDGQLEFPIHDIQSIFKIWNKKNKIWIWTWKKV